MIPRKELPYHRYEQDDTGGNEAEEEYHDNRVFLIHEIVPQARAATGDAAICEEDIEFAKCGRNMVDEQPMEETDRGVSKRREAPKKSDECEEGNGYGDNEDGFDERHGGCDAELCIAG